MAPAACRIVDKSAGQAVCHHAWQCLIESFDAAGQRLTRGGDTFFANIRGPARVRGRVRDNDDGSYTCTFTPTLSGEYAVILSTFGIALTASPIVILASPQQPFAPNCVVSGNMNFAVARATTNFDVEFKDRLGNATHAVDLDVYLESLPIGSPRPQASKHGGDDSADEDGTSEDNEFVRHRNVRYKVICDTALAVRAAVELDSKQIGSILPGQFFTILLEKGGQGRVRAMIALETVGWAAEGVGVGPDQAAQQAGVSSPRLLPPAPVDLLMAPAVLAASVSQASKSPESAAISGETAFTGDTLAAGDVIATDVVSAGALGWVTTVKHGKRFVTSKIRQSTASRRAHADQWMRRAATDRAFSRSKAEAMSRNAEGTGGDRGAKAQHAGASTLLPKISLELDADPSGIGFAYGGVYPGVLHAKGKNVDTHKVSYSVGRVGTYLLHVRLRQQAVKLPGSPFRLEVVPNEAYAFTTMLPVTEIAGVVGEDADSGCCVTITTFDLMGNACIAGGASVSASAVDPHKKNLVTTTVKDNEDGTYEIGFCSSVCGTYQVAIRIAHEHIKGSPATVKFMSVAPQSSKTDLSGDGLTSGVAGKPSQVFAKFFDEFDNRATPGPHHKLGLALLQGKTYKDVQGKGLDHSMTPIDEDKCEYELSFTPSVEGAFSLHIWMDLMDLNGRQERQPLPGSPFQCVILAGVASPVASYVDGWTKESRAVDRHGKVVDSPDLIIAGDTVICRPIICDTLGNKTVPEEGALTISLTLPDGSIFNPDGNRLKLVEFSKGGFVAYDIRHDATHAGDHEMHVQIAGKEIKGSPVPFSVAAALPEVKTAKLRAPTASPLLANVPYTIVLETYDRFGNSIPRGGLAVAARLQIVKASANDLTTLVPNNHTVDVVDNDDGTYTVSVSLINLAATVKAIVNMDKNLPANGGELPAIQLSFQMPTGGGITAPPG